MMYRYRQICWTLFGLLIIANEPIFAGTNTSSHKGSSRWGANYFPNVPLITHEGKHVRFFDDLIKDKVVAINFIYTTCPDSCPLETARLAEVQRILGDRVGKDVFMYSITIDPEHDSPEVLKKYVEKYKVGPGWLFLTGKAADITLLRRKLGLYITEIQNGSNDHNLSLIIGNQATGRWMKSSPFENPYILAKQIGSWLHNWKLPSKNKRGYANAPELRNISKGESLFRTRCVACHTIGGGDITEASRSRIGPDLLGVIQMRDRAWLTRWLKAPEKMLALKDPIAMGMLAKYNNVPMPNMRLNDIEVDHLLNYIDTESRRVEKAKQIKTVAYTAPSSGAPKACCMKKKGLMLSESIAVSPAKASGPKACCMKKKSLMLSESMGASQAKASEPKACCMKKKGLMLSESEGASRKVVTCPDNCTKYRARQSRISDASVILSSALGLSLLLISLIFKKRQWL